MIRYQRSEAGAGLARMIELLEDKGVRIVSVVPARISRIQTSIDSFRVEDYDVVYDDSSGPGAAEPVEVCTGTLTHGEYVTCPVHDKR